MMERSLLKIEDLDLAVHEENVSSQVVYMSTPLFMDSDVFVLDFANNSLGKDSLLITLGIQTGT